MLNRSKTVSPKKAILNTLPLRIEVIAFHQPFLEYRKFFVESFPCVVYEIIPGEITVEILGCDSMERSDKLLQHLVERIKVLDVEQSLHLLTSLYLDELDVVGRCKLLVY